MTRPLVGRLLRTTALLCPTLPYPNVTPPTREPPHNENCLPGASLHTACLPGTSSAMIQNGSWLTIAYPPPVALGHDLSFPTQPSISTFL
ncbi:unnamed protein product [Periconia digitata]|uniref:Uncharacterized protein n=1 Tax=Periconia digitata TaxID=1303443 RepID=A0A9W4U344_9PLEO|nr:unnamed protein product [Periconia digitata]